MEFLHQLWLPILVCSVVLFICSFLVWAVLPHHKDDWAKLPNEDGVREYLKGQNLPTGAYLFPKMGKECHSPEGQAKWKAAPAGELRIWKDASMAKNMIGTYIVFLIASLLTAYVAWHIHSGFTGHNVASPMHGEFADRFQIVGTIGILTYCFSFIPNMIWFQAGKRAMINCIIDGLLYGIVTGATFSWLWPAAEKALKVT